MKQITKFLIILILLFTTKSIVTQDACGSCGNQFNGQANSLSNEFNNDTQGCADDLFDSFGFWMDMVEAYTNPTPAGWAATLAASEAMNQALDCLDEAQSDYNNGLDSLADMYCACCPESCG